MIFHAAYTYSTANRDRVHQRFKETQGAPPPGVTMLGRWHGADGNRGFLVAETADATALAAWLHGWTDLVSFEVTPVLGDAEFGEVIA
jgi:hypothetical protein